MNELCRITVLWDEFWLGSLNQLSTTASERIKALASEVSGVGLVYTTSVWSSYYVFIALMGKFMAVNFFKALSSISHFAGAGGTS